MNIIGEEDNMKNYKVIFHIDEMSKWKLLLANVSNLLNAMDNENFSVKVLANSEAVKYYNTTLNLEVDINVMEYLHSRGVEFIACNNALKIYNMEKNNIINFVSIVPAGVLELVERQSEGYAYIKP